jgi:hypothetical protein
MAPRPRHDLRKHVIRKQSVGAGHRTGRPGPDGSKARRRQGTGPSVALGSWSPRRLVAGCAQSPALSCCHQIGKPNGNNGASPTAGSSTNHTNRGDVSREWSLVGSFVRWIGPETWWLENLCTGKGREWFEALVTHVADSLVERCKCPSKWCFDPPCCVLHFSFRAPFIHRVYIWFF